MVLITRVASAKAGTKSLKSTIPEGIVEFLQLKDKDELEWNMDVEENERIAIVKRKKHDDRLELARYSMRSKKRNGE